MHSGTNDRCVSRNDNDDPNSLSRFPIGAIMEELFGRLWVWTYVERLSRSSESKRRANEREWRAFSWLLLNPSDIEVY